MPLLTADLSDALLECLRAEPLPIDGVEVGPWFSMQCIRDYRHALPQLPFHLHGADLIERVGWEPDGVAQVAAYLQASASPWVSMHITTWPPGAVAQMLQGSQPPPLPDPEAAMRRFVEHVQLLARSVRADVWLENTEPLPCPGYEFDVQPERIAYILGQTGCGFVLDTGHARVSAARLGLEVRAYLSALPLQRVVQVHVSGPRLRDGRLGDVHKPLQEVDYTLLADVLAATQPHVVTLEYTREPQALREQLTRLRAILDACTRRLT